MRENMDLGACTPARCAGHELAQASTAAGGRRSTEEQTSRGGAGLGRKGRSRPERGRGRSGLGRTRRRRSGLRTDGDELQQRADPLTPSPGSDGQRRAGGRSRETAPAAAGRGRRRRPQAGRGRRRRRPERRQCSRPKRRQHGRSETVHGVAWLRAGERRAKRVL